MTQIVRKTQVISVSLPKETVNKLETVRSKRGQSRSAFLKFLVEREAEDQRWEKLYKYGRKIGRRMKITSEDDIDRILHESS